MLILTNSGYVPINHMTVRAQNHQLVMREKYIAELHDFLRSDYAFRSLEYDTSLRQFNLNAMIG